MSRYVLNGGTIESPASVRLTLAHWFAWLTITACLLLAHRDDAKHEVWELKVQGAVDILVCPLYAAAICGAGLAIWGRTTRRIHFPIHPGEWMLVWIGAYAATHETGQLALNAVIPADLSVDSPEWMRQRAYVLEELAPASAHALALCSIAMALLGLPRLIAWQLTFLAAALGQGLYVTIGVKSAVDLSGSAMSLQLAMSAKLLLISATLAAVLIATMELARGIHRNEMHWIGVATGFAPVLHALVFLSPLPFLW